MFLTDKTFLVYCLIYILFFNSDYNEGVHPDYKFVSSFINVPKL